MNQAAILFIEGGGLFLSQVWDGWWGGGGFVWGVGECDELVEWIGRGGFSRLIMRKTVNRSTKPALIYRENRSTRSD
jgi:hypothetical protein